MITLFEKFFGKRYKKGDYVLLKDKEDDTSVELECLITRVHNKRQQKPFADELWYDIEVFDDHGELIEIDINPEEIEREMTLKEIEEYKIRKEAKKYNL